MLAASVEGVQAGHGISIYVDSIVHHGQEMKIEVREVVVQIKLFQPIAHHPFVLVDVLVTEEISSQKKALVRIQHRSPCEITTVDVIVLVVCTSSRQNDVGCHGDMRNPSNSQSGQDALGSATRVVHCLFRIPPVLTECVLSYSTFCDQNFITSSLSP